MPTHQHHPKSMMIMMMISFKGIFLLLFIIHIIIGPYSSSSSSSSSFLAYAQQQQDSDSDEQGRPKIAVIGGGISGTFVSKYLVDLDNQQCNIQKLTIFDPASTTLGQIITKTEEVVKNQEDDDDDDQHELQQQQQQGSRVGTYRMDDGRIIELGASIFIDQFQLIIDMAKSGNLTIGRPFDTNTGVVDEEMKTGFAVYNGNNNNNNNKDLNNKDPIAFNTANITDPQKKKMSIFWRYNLDAVLINWLVNDAVTKFESLGTKLKLPNDHFYISPQHMWDDVGLKSHVEMSLDEYIDSKLNSWLNLVPKDYVPWWRRWFFFKTTQGPLRDELLSAINLVNYNQDNSQINALSGLSSFAVASHRIYGITGGNNQIIQSAFEQAKANRRMSCGGGGGGDDAADDEEEEEVIQHVQKRIATVVGNGLHGFELYDSDGKSVGNYDIVVLAVPYSMANIDFLIKSHIDESVLQPMPLGGLIQAHHGSGDEEEDGSKAIPNGHEGHGQLPKDMPVGVKRPYTQVVTTIVKNGILQPTYFGFNEDIHPDLIPRGIYSTPAGKASNSKYNITSVAQVASQDGLFKLFSSQSLPLDVLRQMFGSQVEIEYEKIWGGQYGGATPDFQALRDNGSPHGTPFLLWDGAIGFHGTTKSSALYYPNSLELTFACIELSAMGSLAVAKLIAQRYDWPSTSQQQHSFDAGTEL